MEKEIEDYLYYYDLKQIKKINSYQKKKILNNKLLTLKKKITNRSDYKNKYLKERDKLIISHFLNEENKHLGNEIYQVLLSICIPIIKKITQNNIEIENDIFQEGIERFIKNLKDLKINIQNNLIVNENNVNTRFSTYIYSIFRNIYSEHLREIEKRGSFPYKYEELKDDYDENEYICEEEKINRMIYVFEQISAKCQKLIELYFFEKLNHKKIAEKLELSNSNTSKSTKIRCMNQLRLLYNQLKE